MKPRLDYVAASPDGYRAMLGLENHVRRCSLEKSLIELVKMRASQINGCAFCIDMHSKDARAAGETEQRLYMLDAWEESPFYSERERAALAWTEAVTRIAETHAPDALYESVKKHFSDQEMADLNWTIAAINAWNRMAIAFRAEPGKYQPAGKKPAQALS